jgi:hypothetical protein
MKSMEWEPGFPSRGVKVEQAVASINELKEKIGRQPTAEDIVKEAKKKRHVLHGLVYDVDEKGAADRYYRDKARKMLSSIKITYVEMPANPVRYYQLDIVKTPGTNEVTTYRNIEEMMAKPALRNQLLEEAKAELAYFQKRYGHLVELAAIFEAWEELK